jgi:hypothetical protein
MEGQMTIYDFSNIENQGDALDFMCKKYEKEDLLTIMWISTDDEGVHHFEIVLRSPKKSKSD